MQKKKKRKNRGEQSHHLFKKNPHTQRNKIQNFHVVHQGCNSQAHLFAEIYLLTVQFLMNLGVYKQNQAFKKVKTKTLTHQNIFR